MPAWAAYCGAQEPIFKWELFAHCAHVQMCVSAGVTSEESQRL